MEIRGAIKKFALVFLCLVVLELVLIGDQVQPVKSLKKKIYMKKLKKIIPLLALVKPKKKLLLIPIPIPLFKNPRPSSSATSLTPSTFTMVDMAQQTMPMMPMMAPDIGMMTTNLSGAPMGMMVTIQSDPNFMPAIDISTNMMAPMMTNVNMSGALIQPSSKSPARLRNRPQFISQQQVELLEPNGIDSYHSPPWHSRLPLSSPARLFRGGFPQSNSQMQAEYRQPVKTIAKHSHQAAPISMMIIKNQWRPTQHTGPARLVVHSPTTPHNSQHTQQNIEVEEIVSVGPPRLIPIYQTSNGQLHMSAPTPSPAPVHNATPTSMSGIRYSQPENDKSFEAADSSFNSSSDDSTMEVRVVGNSDRSNAGTESGSHHSTSGSGQSSHGSRTDQSAPPPPARLQGRSKALISGGY